MATVSTTAVEAAVSRTDNVETGEVHAAKVAVKETSAKTITIRSSEFARTNFYIEQSRKYVGKRKLTRYLYIPYSHWVFLVVGCITVLAFINYIYAFVRVRNMKNRLSKNSSMKIPVHYTCRGKLKTKIVAHKILPLKSCSSLKFPQTVISIIFLHLTEKQLLEILRLLLEIQTRWFDVCCTMKY